MAQVTLILLNNAYDFNYIAKFNSWKFVVMKNIVDYGVYRLIR